jgi:hypothetical protein
MTFDEWAKLPENKYLDDRQFPVAQEAWNAAIEKSVSKIDSTNLARYAWVRTHTKLFPEDFDAFIDKERAKDPK